MSGEWTGSKEWRIRPPVQGHSFGRSDIPPVVCQVLHNRGITSDLDLDLLLDPSATAVHDPALLPGMEVAVQRLYQAITGHETVAIFGDFDVDGTTATALLAQGLGDLGIKVLPYIPRRDSEGHGLNKAAVQALRDAGATVLVTVDCGVTSHQEVALAQDLGMDVVITDHHVPPQEIPPAFATIDPKLESSRYPCPYLSGAGLAFKLVQALYDFVGQPWKRELLELAALSTVADLVPLKDENRFLVKEGMKELQRTGRPGLQALYRQAGIKAESIDVEIISFSIAPRLNAAGRLEDADVSYRLLLTRSDQQAESLAALLGSLNRKRQQLTEEAWSLARDEVRSWVSIPRLLLVGNRSFSPGIAGLVASKLVEEYNRPAVVMCLGDELITASARSIPDFDVGDALSQCRDLFLRHGGHRQAAGFQMDPHNLPNLRERLTQVAEERLDGSDMVPSIDIDAEVPVASLTGETFRWLKDLEPYGVGHPRPVFLTRSLSPMNAMKVGAQGQHLRLKLREGKVVWDAMAFRQADRWVTDAPLVDVVYTIGSDQRGFVPVMALKVLDFRPSDA